MVVGLREKVTKWKGERRDKTVKEGRVGNSSKSVFKEIYHFSLKGLSNNI